MKPFWAILPSRHPKHSIALGMNRIDGRKDWVDIRKDDAHVAREREKARELRKSQWWKARLAEGKCHYCGGSFRPEELTMDHVIPVARGGNSVKSNVVPACEKCNKTKKHLTPVEQILNEMEASGELSPANE